MTRKEFYAEIADLLEIDEEITEQTDLKSFEEFDSLAIMSLVALISSKFNKKIPGIELQKISTPNDLVNLIGADAFTE